MVFAKQKEILLCYCYAKIEANITNALYNLHTQVTVFLLQNLCKKNVNFQTRIGTFVVVFFVKSGNDLGCE